MSFRRPIIGGNWKMYKTPREAISIAKALKVKLINVEDVDIVVCPPFTDLVSVNEILAGSNIKLGGQNLHWQDEGAFTGEISAGMLVDSGCEYVIVGHSERRHVFGEKDDELNKKMRKVLASKLKSIFCVGETLEDRQNGRTKEVVEEQLRQGLSEVELAYADDMVIAYEPVWAIGTGVNATPEQAEEVHQFIRELLKELFSVPFGEQIRIQYGGSVKPANVHDLLSQPNIDGALVGGASLNSDSFTEIIKAAENVK